MTYDDQDLEQAKTAMYAPIDAPAESEAVKLDNHAKTLHIGAQRGDPIAAFILGQGLLKALTSSMPTLEIVPPDQTMPIAAQQARAAITWFEFASAGGVRGTAPFLQKAHTVLARSYRDA